MASLEFFIDIYI